MMNNKVLIICQSIHHGNTMKVAKVIAAELNADIKKPSEVNTHQLSEYDVIGFGSGIYKRRHHISLFRLLNKTKPQENKKTFVFSTASSRYKKMHEPLKSELIAKGFDIIGEFICKGFMNYSFTRYIFGGINKKRPNEKDLEEAKDFAKTIKGTF